MADLKDVLEGKGDTNRPPVLPGLLEIKFEPTLRYVQFPNLDLVAPISESPLYYPPRDEVPTVLAWLRMKGVTEIVELKVDDSLTHPHTEEMIEESIRNFKIQKLDWQRLDIAIKSIKDYAPNLQSLHLYGSGNWGVIEHWTGSEGVVGLTSLQEIYLHLVEGSMTEERVKALKEFAKKRFENRRQEIPERQKQETSHAECRPTWKENFPIIQTIKRGLQKVNKNSDAHDTVFLSTPSTATKLTDFLEAYGNIQRNRSKSNPLVRKRVVILDNGIDFTNNNLESYQLAENIKAGKSFVYGGEKDSPWYIASHLHGTHMASFITEMDPCCDLYIAKICEKTHDITPEAVIRVRPQDRSLFMKAIELTSLGFELGDARMPSRCYLYEPHSTAIQSLPGTGSV